MAIAVEGFTFVTIDESSVTLNKPSGVMAGDLLYIITMRDPTFSGGSYDFSVPSGWTGHLLRWSDEFVQIQTMYKVADGTEGASETLMSTFGRNTVAWYLRVSGVDSSTPIDSLGSYVEDRRSVVVPSLTTTVNGAMAFVLCAFDGGDMDPFSLSGTGWPTSIPTNQYLEESNSGSSAAGLWLTKTVASAGGSESFSVSSGKNDGILGVQFALTPADVSSSTLVSGVDVLNVSSFSGAAKASVSSVSGVSVV